MACMMRPISPIKIINKFGDHKAQYITKLCKDYTIKFYLILFFDLLLLLLIYVL